MTPDLRTNWRDRADACIRNWQLGSVEWLVGVSTAHVAFCSSPSGRAVLKVSVAPGMISDEARALSHFGSEVAPAVYSVSEALEAILLERIEPGFDLASLYPNPRREVASWIQLYRKIVNRSDVPSGFPTLADFARTFDKALSMNLPTQLKHLMQIGGDHREMLMAPTGDNRLLHGDLHHFNVLGDGEGAWKFIDPHGVVGNPLYELGAFLRNPWPDCYLEPGLTERLQERVAILAESLDLPFKTVAMYGFYGAAISIAWTLEDAETDYQGMVLMSEASLRLAGF